MCDGLEVPGRSPIAAGTEGHGHTRFPLGWCYGKIRDIFFSDKLKQMIEHMINQVCNVYADQILIINKEQSDKSDLKIIMRPYKK